MYPQNQQPQSYIAPPPVKRPSGGLSPKLLLIIGGVVVALIIAGLLLMLGRGSSPVEQMQRLSARLETLGTILEQGTQYVRGAELKKVQSDASILIKGDTATLESAMQTAGLAKVDKDIAASETDPDTLEELNDARLNGRFDDAYKKVLAQKIEETMALMREVHDKTNSRALKAALSDAYDHQNSVLEELANL